jgi:GT2 family glycosyltransferase
VVDDGSRDGTPQMLAGYGDSIRVVRNGIALGFAGACNAGVAAAGGEFFILLNNDTIPTTGWLSALVAHALERPEAAVVGVKLLFPNETIQHAGVVFGLDREPHHIYGGFPGDHPATAVSRRFQVVTAACALFRRGPWEELGGLDTDYRNGWEDVDYCMRAGEAGYEIHYCAESVVYHFESATRDLLSAAERENRALFATRWRDKVIPDDFGYYWIDGLLGANYGARYPITLSVSPLLAGVTVGENDRLADRLLYDRARQVMILLRNNIVLNVRVQEAEARAAEAEQRLAAILSGQGPQPVAPLAETRTPETRVPEEEGESVAATNPSDSDPGLPHRIVGMVESPGRLPDVITDGVVIVSGWTLTQTGKATIEAIVNGESRGKIDYGEKRPDAAALYPGFPAGDRCGFSGEIPVADLPDGLHQITVRIWAAEDEKAEITTTFEIDNHAYETGRVIGRLDQPIRGAIFISREHVRMSGWALAPSGIRSVEALLDGEPRGRIDYGSLRPDIAKRRRQYINADHCGFNGVISMQGLVPGSHDLTIIVTANDGKLLELPTRIEIDGTIGIDGGVPVLNRHYSDWLERRGAAPTTFEEAISSECRPAHIAVVIPLSGACEDELEALATSLQAQSFSYWQASLLTTEDTSDEARRLARRLALADDRFDYRESTAAGNIADLNAALAKTDAGWIGLIEPGVILAPNALSSLARTLEKHPDAGLIYSDDDRIDPVTQERWNPFFKPDWSPDLLLAANYLGPLTLFCRRAVLEAGGLREGFPGAETYDLALRVSESQRQVLHAPEVLATTIERAPAEEVVWHRSNWFESERRAIADALKRRDVGASVERGLHPGTWRVRYYLPAELPGVTAVIPTGGKINLLRPCLADLLERTDYPNLEILLVDNSRGTDVATLVAELSEKHPNIHRIVDDRTPFNYSALVNASIEHVTTPFALMLNDDITVIDPGWLRAMVEHGQRPEVGIVGAKLLYPDDTIQHAGVILGPFGGSVHVFKRLPGDEPGYFDLPNVVRNYSAVTFACALIDRDVFDRIGGLDAENLRVAFNDTDFCLRAREAGFEVVYTPYASLYHHESVTKTVIAHPDEIGFLRNRWGHVIDHDPYYNPNLTRQGEDARLGTEAYRVS